MKRIFSISAVLAVFVISTAFVDEIDLLALRKQYEKPIAQWPKPTIDEGIDFQEFKSLAKVDSSYFTTMAQPKVKLGKLLFFDPLLSSSSQVSCSSCHDPQMSFGDKRSVSLGTDHLTGSRNTPSLLNVAKRKSLFWDGRAGTLQEQAIIPLATPHEMAMDTKLLGEKLGKIKAYVALFKDAYGTETITIENITDALAKFQETLVSRRSRFDRFLDGEYKALTDQEIHGMHLFRTKARCMNCHNGEFLTDESFHNIGLTYYKRKYNDLGRYEVTKDPKDVGKFKTPSLRDVMNNNPWMHNGLFDNITGVVNLYNSGMHMIDPTPEQKAKDPLYPQTDPILQKLNLSRDEIQAVVAFMNAITATQYKMPRPELVRDKK
ncbi:cytochrome-c peroxidase [Pedobacter sp.]|uniref:cytochrome-c peroxidase n=1 Tax=Pedobacter sp. TaxID=1411316 RepID=UPI003D7F9210